MAMQKPLLTFPTLIAAAFLSLSVLTSAGQPGLPSGFTRLEQLSAPKIIGSSEAYPGGQYNATNITDGNPKTEYSSASKGTDTFIEFDFGAPAQVAAFRHLDRNDPATVASSVLTFAVEKITHLAQSSAQCRSRK